MIRPWLDCGFRVLSVNHPDEISSLAATYPEISFIANEKDARAISPSLTPP